MNHQNAIISILGLFTSFILVSFSGCVEAINLGLDEAGAEAGVESSTESSTEPYAEVGEEAGTEAGTETEIEVSVEAGTEDGIEVSEQAGSEESAEAGAEAGAENGEENELNPCPYARITTELSLRLRPQPNTEAPHIAQIPFGAVVEVHRRVSGMIIEGNDEWLEVTYINQRGFVSAYYTECVSHEEWAMITEDSGYYLPLECGSSARITQGNGGSTSHQGRTQYAFDFGISLNTPVIAMRAGVVSLLKNSTREGDPCYHGGDSSCGTAANFVLVTHSDGTRASYVHLNEVHVTAGQVVHRGQELGLSGSTGYSTGPHLHAELQEDCGETRYCQTIPLRFEGLSPNVPISGQVVSSNHCP